MGLENRGQVIFFRLITSAVSGQPLSAEDRALYAPAMLPGMTALARRHDLVHLLALGLKNNGLLDEGSGELENEIFRAAARSKTALGIRMMLNNSSQSVVLAAVWSCCQSAAAVSRRSFSRS